MYPLVDCILWVKKNCKEFYNFVNYIIVSSNIEHLKT